jgi:hypothetical protein
MKEIIRKKISFSVEGSLVDLSQQEIPNFSRSSPIWLEKEVNGGFQCYPVAAFYPAFSPEGTFVIDPGTVNLVDWNIDYTQSVWLKGSNVVIFPDEVPAANTTYTADVVLFAPGNGITQTLSRNFNLLPGTDYYLTVVAGIRGDSRADLGDVLRVTGDVVEPKSLSLERLNDAPNRYSLLELKFKTSGVAARFPGQNHSGALTIISVTVNTATIIVPSDTASVAVNEYIGGDVTFSNNISKRYRIIANTNLNLSNRTIILTFNETTLINDGVTTNSTLLFRGASLANIKLEFYSESTIALMLSGIQIEAKKFRTPLIFQEQNVLTRGVTTLVYRKSPIAGLRTFGIFIEIVEWRGEGNIFDAGNLKAYISDGNKITVEAGGTVIRINESAGSKFKLFIQVSQETVSMSVYLNGVLKGRAIAPNFVGSATGQLIFDSEGYREWQRFFVCDQILLDRSQNTGDLATNEVAEIFSESVIIDPVLITNHNPIVKLNPVTIPPKQAPLFETFIENIEVAAEGKILVSDASGLVVGTSVDVFREGRFVLSSSILVISDNIVTLSNLGTAGVGDRIVYGFTDIPGMASIRFPYDPSDSQKILAINGNRLTVQSSLSFQKGISYINNEFYEDIAEAIITEIDNVNGYLFLGTENPAIKIGDIISQPLTEMSIDPPNYFYGLLRPSPGIKLGDPHTNGIIAYNENGYPTQIHPFIRVYL